MIQSVDILVGAVNGDPRIRPYLNNDPFEPKNVEIRIFLRGVDHLDVPIGELSMISALEGVFDYMIDSPQTRRLTLIDRETYEEAHQKFKGELINL